jgi:hypothetical protein
MPAGWHIADGVLTKTGQAEDIITRITRKFQLALDWKLGRVATPGFLSRYRGYDHIY